MSPELAGDLEVDVLVVGGGIQGLYLARALAPDYSVCIVTDPDAPSETLDSHGYFSAGYEGNDMARIQPARRAAGYWKLWAESNGVPHHGDAPYAVLPAAEAAVTSRLWADATLAAPPAEGLPAIFDKGSLDGLPAFRLENDTVMSPTDVVAELRRGIEDRILWGTVSKWGVATERAVDFVDVETADALVPLAPRYVVCAANVGNGMLLHSLVARFKDHTKRREAGEKVRGCQAVRRRLTLAVRGNDLPLVAGRFGDLDITAHRLDRSGDDGSSGEVVWLVSPPIDDRLTVLGPEEHRFDPTIDAGWVRDAMRRLFEVAPGVRDRAAMHQWGVWMARHTQHPSMAVKDASLVPQPAPAKLETLDLEGFVAIWPSHLAYAMITGDVVAERIREALGPTGDLSGPAPGELSPSAPEDASKARWERDSFRWVDFGEFAGAHDFTLD